jgi:DNA polymerase
MLIGEAPGQNEDEQGIPFIGRAGQLLDKMLLAINYKREDVYVANVVCCRPPANRRPALREVAQCMDYLVRQIRVVSPKVLVLLGKTATEAVLGRTFKSLEGARQNWYEWDNIPLRATYHPAYLLRNSRKKQEALEDLKSIRAKVMQVTERFDG